jgi:hypothetical protein
MRLFDSVIGVVLVDVFNLTAEACLMHGAVMIKVMPDSHRRADSVHCMLGVGCHDAVGKCRLESAYVRHRTSQALLQDVPLSQHLHTRLSTVPLEKPQLAAMSYGYLGACASGIMMIISHAACCRREDEWREDRPKGVVVGMGMGRWNGPTLRSTVNQHCQISILVFP